MDVTQTCPQCGALLNAGKTCQDDFYQMLFWEADHPRLAAVHHLMVLCFHLQHPTLYSPQGLAQARQLLAAFVIEGVSPATVRWQNRAQVDSGRRRWKVAGTPASFGTYEQPVQWSITAADVIGAGPDAYCERVQAWAQSIYETLNAANP